MQQVCSLTRPQSPITQPGKAAETGHHPHTPLTFGLVVLCSPPDSGPRQLCPSPSTPLLHLPDPPGAHLPPGQAYQPEQEEGGDTRPQGGAAALR